MVVLDASVALSWVLPNEQTAPSKAILEKLLADDEEMIVPEIWPLEVANVIWVNLVKRGRLNRAQAQEACEYLKALDVAVDGTDTERCFNSIFPLAVQHQLTIYDTAYLELAWRLGKPIVTDDARVIAAAVSMRIAVYAA